MTKTQYQYDVAFSFAGEDREYVERVAERLHAAGVPVFYDKYEQVELWGEDLYQRLDNVYRREARFCVIFISAAYRDKVWTNHELRSAQARALEAHEVYILPARFNDTEIPGILSTIGYVDLRDLSPEEFANVILGKLGATGDSGQAAAPVAAPAEPGFNRPRLGGRAFNPYDAALGFIDSLTTELKRRCDMSAEDGVSASLFDRESRKCLRVVLDGETIYSLDVWMGGMLGDNTVNFHGGRGEIRSSTGTTNAWGDVTWDRERESVVLDFHDLSLLKVLGAGNEQRFVFPEFTEALWEVIREALETAY